jgi:hypothetical protein
MEKNNMKSHNHDHDHEHATPRRSMRNRFTALLLQWASERRPKAAKLRKEMTEEELKACRTERNRRRRKRAQAAKTAKAVAKNAGHKLPKRNTGRRHRLAEKHPERKLEQK